jgi:RHS repeat-associated protein
LLKRQLSIGNNVKEEVFAYDNLERLEQHRFDEIPPLAVTPPPLNISYDPQGKILSKTDAGLDYRYNMNAQLKKIQQHQAAISLNEQNITYTPFRSVNTIEENGIELTYSYGPDQSRYKGIWKNNGTQYRKRIYASGYEINEETVNGVTTTQNISYVSAPSGLCAMYVEENGSGTFYYVHTDHLGSITAVTNANGNVIARQNFDAWGRRRKVQDYSYLPQNTTSTDNGLNNSGTLPKWLYRGYTGHEHLDEFALINMNARLYDPVVGMFLSPDKYIQAPGNTQNYNRYAYCLNNPLKYSDPSGNITYAAMVGFIHGFTSTSEGRFKAGFLEAGRRVENSLKIWNGLVTYDTHYSGKGDWFRDAGEIISRLTWQLPQTLSGMEFAQIQLFDLLGKEIFNCSLSSGTHLIQLPEDAGGIYLLKIIDNKGNHESKKIIIN